jgi:hypothetical protein
MTMNIIAPSSGGGRITEISVGVLFGIFLIAAICATCYYVRKRRTRARLEQKATDIECENRDGSVTTLDDSHEKDLSPEDDNTVDFDHGDRDGGIARLSHYHDKELSPEKDRSANSSVYEIIHDPTLGSSLQLSIPEIVHLKN